MTTTAPIGIYVRVSRKGDREDERFHSPKEQAERATALVRAKGLVPGPVYEDIDVSGAKAPAERPAMGRLLGAIEAGELGGIAAFALDRLSREPVHGDELVRRVTKPGGLVLTPDIPDAIDSPTGEFTFGMLLQVAKLYRSQAGARFASAKERSILAGIPVSNPPLGYRRGADRRLELDPELAPVVRELFERRAAGASWSELVETLDEARGKKHPKQTVAAIIGRRLYATGRLEYGDVVSEHEAEPVVDEALWHAAQRAKPMRPARGSTPWLLTGLVRCDACGNSMVPWTGASQYKADPRRGRNELLPVKTRSRRYRCNNRACPARERGPMVSVDAPRLESWVVTRSMALGDELTARADAPDLGALETAVALAERRLEQVLAPEARDALGELWAADVKARRLELNEALTELGVARQAAGVAGAQELNLRELWEGLSPADRRSAIALYWRAIYVAPRAAGGHPLRLVARGPHAEVEVELPNMAHSEDK